MVKLHLYSHEGMMRGQEVHHHSFLISVLGGVEQSVSCHSCFIPGERFLDTNTAGGCMGPRAGPYALGDESA